MKYQKDKADPVKTLIFIMIGAVLIVFTDLFILDGKKYIWWDKKTPKAIEAPTDLSNLRTQHQIYMENGIYIPDSVTAKTALPDPIERSDYKTVNIQDVEELIAIEPAIGVERKIIPTPEIKTENYEDIERIILDTDTTESNVSVEPKQENKAYSYAEPKGRGKIAIIIDDMGITLRSKLVEVLPGPLTLSYLPYAKDLPERTKRARANGHELMVHIPMEPINGSLDGGPHVLRSDQSKQELIKTLNWGLSQFDGFVGVNNHMGSRVTTDKTAMSHVMRHLKTRNLYFIDSRTIGTSVAADVARQSGLAYGKRDIFLDHEITPEFIRGALEKLENKAYEQGYAIAIGHPHKATIEALKEWIPTLKEKGLTLVPASAVLNKPVEQSDILVGHTSQ